MHNVFVPTELPSLHQSSMRRWVRSKVHKKFSSNPMKPMVLYKWTIFTPHLMLHMDKYNSENVNVS